MRVDAPNDQHAPPVYGANKEEAVLVYRRIRERWATVPNLALEMPERAGVLARPRREIGVAAGGDFAIPLQIRQF